NPGDAKYADKNNDGIVDGNDKIRTGYGNRPEYVFGLNAGLNWKGLNFSMQWSAATHVDRLMNAATYRIPFTNAGGRGLLKYFYEDCWTEENRNGTLPRAAETSEAWNSEDSTLWLRDASYIRLKTIQIGYNFSGYGALDKVGIKSIGLSLSGYNLLTFSPLKFMDPEAMPSVTSDYPLVKIYSLGLNITF
ncbi:MAG: SusC/RagA family TonB-linked outer membrane protein, partial [Bacteroidales bacterium]|nr:SusC/RagA family TonB-linked outer membrane protein [Bacteroidales bacterium]